MRAKTLSAVLALLAAQGLVGCGPQVPVSAPETLELTAEAIPGDAARQPEGPAGACWGRDTIPAVIETETVTRLVAPATATSPATYRSESHQKMVRDTKTVWIRTPCYDQLTPDTILTLQRALRARGYYLGPLEGMLSPETMTAVRRFQEDHGLDTKVLSLKAAQMLGLVLTPVS
jgi:hypothetical protein